MTFSTLGTDTTTNQPVYLYKTSRFQGLYVIGATGTGKSGLFENLIYEDGKQGIGFCVIDPHGQLIERVIARIPANREQDVILIDINDYQYPFGLNLFTCSDPSNSIAVQEVVDRVMHVFEKLLGVSHDTPLILQYLRNCTYTLIANPGYTMADIPLLLQDDQYRRKLLTQVTDPDVLLFWRRYEQMKPSERDEQAASILRRVEDFLQPLTRPIVGQSISTMNMQDIMDKGKILLVKLNVLKLEQVSNFIGSLVIAQFLNSLSTRTNLFNMYVDEFQRFSTKDFATLFAEARKFGIGLTVAHQFRDQLDQDNKGATLTAANLIVFRVSSTDADELAGQFDITPQAAWEQVIEEESVQVLKEEWFEPITDVIEDGVEEIQTPVSNPFDWLVSHSHSNPVIKRFMDGEIHTYLSSEYAKYVRADLNSFLFRAMTSSDPLAVLCEKSLCSLLLYLNDHYPIAPFYFGQTVAAAYNEERTYNVKVHPYVHIPVKSHRGKLVERGLMSDVVSPPSIQLYRKKGTTEPDETMAAAIVALIRATDEVSFARAASSFQTLARAKLTASLKKYLACYQAFYETQFVEWRNKLYIPKNDPLDSFFISPFEHGLIIGNGRFYTPEEVAKRCSVLPDRIIAEERQTFETFIREFRDFVLALAKDPPETSSGLTKPRKRTQVHYLTHPRETITHPRKTILHPQRTYADMKNDMANQLVGLPDYMARVKLKSEPEHLIQTVKPAPGLYGTVLQKRIEDIQNRNRKDRFTRPRQEVEVEIRMRQAALRQAAQPQVREVPQPLQRERRYPVEPQSVQPSAASDSQLKQAIAALTPERWQQDIDKGLIDDTLTYAAWYTQEVKKLLKQG